jgi:protocatechuate 3,4-dioxygenase beta subunit
LSRNVALVIAGLGLAAGLGLSLLLSGDDEAQPGATLVRPTAPAEARGLPTFAAEGGPDAAPEALAREGGVIEAGDAVPGASAKTPVGPVRRVQGHVHRLSDGTPLEEVIVSASAGNPAKSLSLTTTGPDGAFDLAGVPVDCDSLLLTWGPSGISRPEPLAPGAADITGLEITLDSGFILRGIVLDAAGAPLAGAQVDVGRRREGQADEAGRFALRDVTAEPMDRVLEVRAWAQWHERATAEVLVPRSSTESPFVELRLTGSGRLAGRVSWTDGTPAIGAQVGVGYLMAPDGDSREIEGLDTSTDEDGLYDIDWVPAGRFLVSAGRGTLPPGAEPDSQAGRVPLELWIPDVDIAVGRVTTLDIVLPPPAAIAGRALDVAGRPVAGARVALRRVARWPAPGINGHSITSGAGILIDSRGGDGQGETTLLTDEADQETDERGEYAFEGLAEGERTVEARVADGRLAPQSRTVLVRAGTRHAATDFVLFEGLTLRAQVVDLQGRPLEGASVHVADESARAITSDDLSARSGADGWFEVHGLSPGKKTLTVFLAGYTAAWRSFEPESPPARIELKPSLKLRGEVVDAATGQAIEAFALRLEFEGTSMITDAQPHPGGLFEDDVPGDVRCKVTVSAPGYEPVTLDDLLPSSTAVAPARFRLLRQP